VWGWQTPKTAPCGHMHARFTSKRHPKAEAHMPQARVVSARGARATHPGCHTTSVQRSSVARVTQQRFCRLLATSHTDSAPPQPARGTARRPGGAGCVRHSRGAGAMCWSTAQWVRGVRAWAPGDRAGKILRRSTGPLGASQPVSQPTTLPVSQPASQPTT